MCSRSWVFTLSVILVCQVQSPTAAQRRNTVAHRDIAYAETDHVRQRLDLFLPTNRKAGELLPVIAFVHGGGWRNGDEKGGEARVAPLVASGRYAGVSIGYRLSGDAIWPAQIHDCKAAIRWIRAHAGKYGLDADLLDHALRQAGVEVTFVRMIGGEHGFRSEALDERFRQFLARHLLGESVTIAATPITVSTGNRRQSPPLIKAGARVEKLADGFVFTEGPARDRHGNMFFSDVRNNRIHRWSTDGKLSVFRENSGAANGLYFDKAGNLIACEGGNRRLTSISMDGEVTVLADQYDGKPLNSPNDVWIDPQGGIYFTDPRYGNEDGLEQDGYHVYYLAKSGDQPKRVVDNLKKPNGVVGSADGKRLFVADPGDQKTYVYHIARAGELTDRRLIAVQGSDGMTLDERGNLYLTQGAVQVYDPSGKLLETIEIPERPSNVCFGGADGKTLFITARKGFYALRMNVRGN